MHLWNFFTVMWYAFWLLSITTMVIVNWFTNRGCRRSISGGAHIHIFMLCIINFFWNRLFLQSVNTSIWICAPPPQLSIFCGPCLPNNVCIAYTARNATDLLQVVELVNCTSLLQVANKLQQVCWLHQVAASLRKLDLNIATWYVQIGRKLLKQRSISSLWMKVLIMLISSPLTTCSRLELLSSNASKWCERIMILAWWWQSNKPATDLLQLMPFWLCIAI